jgi:hypothetical protein
VVRGEVSAGTLVGMSSQDMQLDAEREAVERQAEKALMTTPSVPAMLFEEPEEGEGDHTCGACGSKRVRECVPARVRGMGHCLEARSVCLDSATRSSCAWSSLCITPAPLAHAIPDLNVPGAGDEAAELQPELHVVRAGRRRAAGDQLHGLRCHQLLEGVRPP